MGCLRVGFPCWVALALASFPFFEFWFGALRASSRLRAVETSSSSEPTSIGAGAFAAALPDSDADAFVRCARGLGGAESAARPLAAAVARCPLSLDLRRALARLEERRVARLEHRERGHRVVEYSCGG